MDTPVNYSIIIPHKNMPGMLRHCLDSIPRRDDVQVIVVDDNSDPDIVDFAHFPGLGEPHVEVRFTKKGKGGGYARNVGMKRARGKWLMFADADDYFFTDKLSALMDKYKNVDDVEVVYLNAVSYEINTTKKSTLRQPAIAKILDDDTLSASQKEERVRFECWEPWTRMCRRCFVKSHHIRFDEIPRINDKSFGLKVSIYSSKYRIEKDAFYCWVANPQSISARPFTEETFKDDLRIAFRMSTLFRKHHIARQADYKFYIDYAAAKYDPLFLRNFIRRFFIVNYLRNPRDCALALSLLQPHLSKEKNE